MSTDPVTTRRRDHPRVRAVAVAVAVVVCALAGAWLGLTVAGQTDRQVGPFDAHVSLRLAPSGDTVVELPPLGTLSVDSHDGPLGLSVRVTELRAEDARRIVNDPDVLQRLGDEVGADLRAALLVVAVQGAAGALVGAAAVTLLVLRRTRRAAVGAGLAGLVLVGSAGTAALTANRSALTEPTYTGVLASAPALVGNVSDIVTRFDSYGKQLAGLVDNVTQLYGAASTLPVLGGGGDLVRLLHVSDIHSNPAAYEVISQVVTQFDVDAVVDTGDITDRGATFENALLAPIGELGVPYVYVRGNHDSRSTEAAVAAQPNAVVLDGEPETVAGLTMLGLGDPRYTPDIAARPSRNLERAALATAADRLAEAARAMSSPPDVVLVHDPAMADEVFGSVPLVLAGHGHRREREDRDGTLYRQEGSTGGAGLRGLEGEDPTPLMASVLYLDAVTHELVAYDDITLGGLGLSSATIERQLVGATALEEAEREQAELEAELESEGEATPTPSPSPSGSSSGSPSGSPSPSGEAPSGSPSPSGQAPSTPAPSGPSRSPAGSATPTG